MLPNDYIHGFLVRAHQNDLLREAEHEHLLAQLPQPEYKGWLLAWFMRLWHTLRVKMPKLFRRLMSQKA